MRRLSLVFIYLSFSLIYSQTITIQGVIRDKYTSRGLDSAYVILINKHDPSRRDTFFANQSGFFSFLLTVQNDHSAIKNFYISNPYPNPFNPSVNLDIYIPETDILTIEIYDLLGKLIDKKKFNLFSGNYRMTYNGKGGAGIYFIVLRYKGIVDVKKIVQTDNLNGHGIKISPYQLVVDRLNKNVLNEYYLIGERFLYVPDTLVINDLQNQHVVFDLETVHQNAILIDLHNDVLEKVVTGYDLGVWNSSNHSDLPRFYKGAVDVQFMALWVSPSAYPNNPFSQTLRMIDSFKVQLNKYNNLFDQAKTSRELDSLIKIKKFSVILCVEGGHSIENDIYKLDTLYKLGARYLTITWNNSTSWATSAQDPQATTKGLSEFGRQVIRHMDSLGMLIDVSHVGPKTIEDILETTVNPIIATHSGVKALRNHYRNLSDQQIIKIAQKGGVIGIIFYPPYLTNSSTATISNVIAHIDYIKNLVGIDYIALGSDFDGIERVVVGLEDVTRFSNLTEALLRRGYSISDVRKILGENFLRVFKQVCK